MANHDDTLQSDLALEINELARRAKIGRTLLYEEIRSGRLKARKIGRRTIILAEDARAWLTAAPRVHGEAL